MYSSLVVAQLLFLQSEDSKKPIHIYINSPGGLLLAIVKVSSVKNLKLGDFLVAE